MADIGNRELLTTIGALVGVGAGVALAALSGLALGADLVSLGLLGSAGALVGSTAGLGLTLLWVSPPGSRKVGATQFLIGTVSGLVVAGVVVGGGFAMASPKDPFTETLAWAAVFASLPLGFGMILGMAYKGSEKREHEAVLSRLEALDIHRQLETAIEAKFGSLDDALRERIRTWDEGRVAEAARRLPTADTPDDLEWQGGPCS